MKAHSGNIYLDTSALVRMVECDVEAPSERSLKAGKPVAELCSSGGPQLGLSELTIIELHQTLAVYWRTNNPGYERYDQAWVEHSQVKVMQLLAAERLTLRFAPPHAYEHAIALVTLATRDHRNALGVWDAIHLITAAAWAREIGAIVELWTTDKGFRRFVDLFPHFEQFVHVRNLDECPPDLQPSP